jgi:hypothetical protein
MQMVLTVCSTVARKTVPTVPTVPAASEPAPVQSDGDDAPDYLVLAKADILPQATGIGEGRTPYNSQVLLWVTNWLIQLADPRKPETHRAFGLSLINVALETSANMIGQVPVIVSVIGHDLCKYLLQNTQTEEVTILSLTLRVIFNLFNSSLKAHLKARRGR